MVLDQQLHTSTCLYTCGTSLPVHHFPFSVFPQPGWIPDPTFRVRSQAARMTNFRRGNTTSTPHTLRGSSRRQQKLLPPQPRPSWCLEMAGASRASSLLGAGPRRPSWAEQPFLIHQPPLAMEGPVRVSLSYFLLTGWKT